MDKVLNLYKKRSETPLECIQRFKAMYPEYAEIPMTYAGRLDPLAEGVLIVLAGEGVHMKEDFLTLPKEYDVCVLFGASTDTYDSLGMLSDLSFEPVDVSMAQDKLKDFIGKHSLPYPPYSSKPVNGKPLFMWAREGSMSSVEIPTKEVEIFSIKFEGWKNIYAKDLLQETIEAIQSVKGDFRQEASILEWKKKLEGSDSIFGLAQIRVSCSSGAYMRSLAHEWGKTVGLPALAYGIVRTKVGDFRIEDSMK